MKNVLSATEARNRFFEILNSVIYRGEEFVVRKKDSGSVKIVPDKQRPSSEEIDRILKEIREVFGNKKRKYWSIIDTPAWKKKERRYLERISKGIID